MPFVTSHGTPIYYERHGSGPAVLFLHGAGSNAATWWQQLPQFGRQHTCLTLDLRHFGRSSSGPLQDFSLPQFADDVLAVLDQEGIGRVAVVGQSLGGMVGLQLVLRDPQRIAAFAACDTTLAVDHPGVLEIIRNRQMTHKAVSIEERSLGRWFLERHPDKAALYAQINHFNPSFHTISGPDWGRALMAMMEGGRAIPMAALPTLQVPTLLLVGREDPIVPVPFLQEVQALVAGSELAVVDDAGHSTYFEQPAEFNRLVLDFLARRAAW